MHELEKKLIEFGAIDNIIESLTVDDWFEKVTITYIGSNGVGKVICDLNNCFEISLLHDKTYSKGRGTEGNLDYKYFIQDIEIVEKEGFYFFEISAWPLNGHIICKKITITTSGEC